MKKQPELLVDLDGKLTRVLAHWAAVDEALPPQYPLVLRKGFTRELAVGLAADLSRLRDVVLEEEVNLGIARGNYKVRKAEMHRLLRIFNSWMRGSYKWSEWFVVVRRVPGRKQSYEHWSAAASNALVIWQLIVEAPPEPWVDPLARPLTLGDGTTVEQFAELVRAFEATWWGIIDAEVDYGIARGNLKLAQAEATALLMAYGHGVLARFGPHDELVRSMPQLWPKHPRKQKAA